MYSLTRTFIKAPGARAFGDYSAEVVLSHENMLRTMSKFQDMPAIRMRTQEPTRKAAVLIPLCVVDDKLSLLYTLRASNMRMHKGQVSFPGGIQESKDKSLELTALRETKEELGISENQIKIWGRGNLIVAKSETSILPIVGTLSDNLDVKNLRANPSEVEQVFTVPLEELCNTRNIAYTQFRAGYTAPVFLAGSRRIWGLTALITNAFLKCLLPSSSYNHKLKYVSPFRTSTEKDKRPKMKY